MTRGIIVTNSGTHPELAHLAAELDSRGQLWRYHTSLGVVRGGWLDHVSAYELPGSAPLRRRRLPEGLTPARLELAATAHELATFAPLGPGYRERAIRRRNRAFERDVSRQLRREAPQV